ncbi:MAG: hypothetical protein HYV90_05205 [Candidatus Woesebacteria bacterium]|nr:MAG: hypothetical protein HYV90_05205 [Candidatus Woesebacteria bacterium]
MEINTNRTVRAVVRRLLALQDRLQGVALPKMARIKQVDIYSCGPAVLAMLFSFLGVKVFQKRIVASLRAQKKIRKWGMSVRDLARASKIAGKGGFSFWKKANSKISDLDTIVNKYGFPVGVEWQGVFYEDADEDDGHYGVVTRVDKNRGYLRIADPFHKFAGVDRRFRIKDFQRRWWDSNEIKVGGTSKPRTITDKRMMFIITPKGDSWPKKLGMTKV